MPQQITKFNGQCVKWMPYWKNNYLLPDADSNFNQTWKGISPFLERLNGKPTNTLVTLKRFSDDGKQALGDLSYGSFNCKTLERPWKNNQSNISCIPTGVYECKYTFSPRLLKYTYEILNVPNRTGIRLHSGNYAFKLNGKPDIYGCILLGNGYNDINGDSVKDIINSRVTISLFEKCMNKKPFTLIIKNDFKK